MINLEETREQFRISTDKSQLDLTVISNWLTKESYWATNRSLETIKLSIENSLCFGVYEEQRQIGFARIVTDYATFAWLCDVFILNDYKGKGLGKWLVETITTQPVLKNLRSFILATRDAHGLYERYGGFQTLAEPTRWMVRPKK
ncbi:MAG: GNAT family N-acetyltransferase [Ignavibacteriaceae bacterium]|jgi:GNAT superfamily N-acetyltransferase